VKLDRKKREVENQESLPDFFYPDEKEL